MRNLHLQPHGVSHPTEHCPRLPKHPEHLLQHARRTENENICSGTTEIQNRSAPFIQNILVENIRNKKKHTQEVIIQARHETLDFVNRFFDAKEKEVLRKMEADEKKLGLHNENRMDALLNIISRDVNGLFAAAQDLNSQDFLESFHRIRTQVIANSLQT